MSIDNITQVGLIPPRVKSAAPSAQQQPRRDRLGR